MNRKDIKTIAIDFDGTLSEGECWTPEDCLKAKPRQSFIEFVNELYKTNFIVIYTARRDELIPASLEWLRRNNVMYNAFSNNKMGCDVYIDDKAYNVNRFTN